MSMRVVLAVFLFRIWVEIAETEFSVSLSHTEADFVGSSLVKESLDSSTGDDDKLYFFFTERSHEEMSTYGQSRVATVARVCKVSAALKRKCHQTCYGSRRVNDVSVQISGGWPQL